MIRVNLMPKKETLTEKIGKFYNTKIKKNASFVINPLTIYTTIILAGIYVAASDSAKEKYHNALDNFSAIHGDANGDGIVSHHEQNLFESEFLSTYNIKRVDRSDTFYQFGDKSKKSN